jgi:hypothetical protein
MERAGTVEFGVVGADKMSHEDRFNFLSFWNRSVKAISSACEIFRAWHITTYGVPTSECP